MQATSITRHLPGIYRGSLASCQQSSPIRDGRSRAQRPGYGQDIPGTTGGVVAVLVADSWLVPTGSSPVRSSPQPSPPGVHAGPSDRLFFWRTACGGAAERERERESESETGFEVRVGAATVTVGAAEPAVLSGFQWPGLPAAVSSAKIRYKSKLTLPADADASRPLLTAAASIHRGSHPNKGPGHVASLRNCSNNR